MIVSLEEQMALIRSHLASIERQKAKGDWGALATFCDGISRAAATARDYCEGKEQESKQA